MLRGSRRSTRAKVVETLPVVKFVAQVLTPHGDLPATVHGPQRHPGVPQPAGVGWPGSDSASSFFATNFTLRNKIGVKAIALAAKQVLPAFRAP